MKKQVLFILVSAFFAVNMAFGQSLPGSLPQPVSCVSTPLNPIAGTPYVYEASANPGGGMFTFWATKDPNFITSVGTPPVTTTNVGTKLTTPAQLIATSANYGAADAAAQVSITWSDAVLSATDPLTSPTFVAVYYAAPAAPAGCADNFNAWQIIPILAFTVDIMNIEDAAKTSLGYGSAENQCADVVRRAVYDGAQIQFDFGTNILYFEVVAANFTGSWTPAFLVTGLNAVQSSLVEWTYDKPATWTAATVWHPATDVVNTLETNTSTGVSIYARVTVTNTTFENLAGIGCTLAVDGLNSVGDWDVINSTCAPTLGADQNDFALQTILARPTVTPVAPPAFLPNNKN